MQVTLQQIRDYVIKEFELNDTSKLYYHNLEHTKGVAENVGWMIESLELESEASFVLRAAAWWHDIGYLYGYEEHERRGMRLAAALLPPMGLSDKQVSQVQALIAATELGHSPKTPLQALLADADLAYGITQNFEKCGDQLRKEWAWYKNKIYTEQEWAAAQLQFLQTVEFHSDFGKQYYQPFVQENLKKQKIRLATLTKE